MNEYFYKTCVVAGVCVLCALVPPVAPGQQTLTLHDAIVAGLGSPNARISEEQVGVAQGQVHQAALRPNPRLYLQSEDIHPWDSNFSFPDNTEDYGYLGQSIEVDGKRGKRIALANANLHRSEAEHTLRTRQIAASVAAAYWMAVADEHIAQLLRQDIAEVDAMVRYNKDRVTAGATRGVDLIRMQIERDRIYLSLQAAERDADLARIDLGRKIGMRLPANVKLTDDISVADQLPAIDLATALAQRADVAVAREEVAAAKADLKLQHALAVPDPDIFAGYKRDVGINTAYGGLQILLPIFNRNQGEVARAEAQLRVARASLEQTELMVRADIEAAEENYIRESAIVRDTLPPMRDRAGQNLTILREAYRTGGVDLLRYIDAERTGIDAEVTAVRTLADFHQAVLRLQLALGVQP